MKFVQIGGGVIGEMRARAVLEHPECQLVGVADPDPAAAARAAQGSGARTADDYAEFLDGEHCDAVIVSTPVQLHEKMILDALSAGKHVFCEKPLSNSHPSCQRIVAAAHEAGRAFAVGFNHRFYPSFAYMAEAIREGRIGRVDSLRVMGGHDGLSNFRADWMYQGEISGGGAMMDVGIHMTDLARFMVGEIDSVYAHRRATRSGRSSSSEDRAHAIMKASSGVSVQYEASWNEWKGFEVWMEAYGDGGMIRASYGPDD